MSNCSGASDKLRYSVHSTRNPKNMHINPHFNQAKSALATPYGVPHLNRNFYTKHYELDKSAIVIKNASMVHINPKFVNIKKLHDDLLKAQESKVTQAQLCPLSYRVLRSDEGSHGTSLQCNPTPSSSRSSMSKYKLVNVNVQDNSVKKSQAAPSEIYPPSTLFALQTQNSFGQTPASSDTSKTTYYRDCKSKYKLVRDNNLQIPSKTATSKTTVRVSRYKTVPLQMIIPQTVTSVGSKRLGNDLKGTGNIFKRNSICIRKIDRRKPNRIAGCVPNSKPLPVASKFNSFNKSISIRGKVFSVTDKSLKLVRSKPVSSNMNTSGKLTVRVNGRIYIQKSHNLFVRKQFVVRNRNSLKKNNVPCPQFRKFGKCIQKENGKCSLLHDKRHVTICRTFLRGQCLNENCLLSHQVTAEKMPTCSFYLKGCCSRDSCPYLHVKVSDSAVICTDFLKGYCERGGQCTKRHVYLCPEFAKNGKCTLRKCTYPHKEVKKITVKNILPAKFKKINIVSDVLSTDIDDADQRNVDCSNETTSVKERRYYVCESQEACEGGSVVEEMHTTREKLGSLPSFISF